MTRYRGQHRKVLAETSVGPSDGYECVRYGGQQSNNDGGDQPCRPGAVPVSADHHLLAPHQTALFRSRTRRSSSSR